MNLKDRKNGILVVLLIILSLNVFSQKGIEDGSQYGHGEDSIRAIKSLSLFSEFVKQKNFDDALPYWRVVFFESPRASKNIYIRGVSLMENRIKTSPDKASKNAYIDTLMMVYDQRIKYFGNDKKYSKDWILGKKGMALFKHKKADIEKVKEALGYLEQSMQAQKEKTTSAVCITYMQVTYYLFKKEELEKDKVVETYLDITEVLNVQMSTSTSASKKKRTSKVIQTVEKMFFSSGVADCNILISIAEKKYSETPNDKQTLKKNLKLMKQKDCNDSKIYFTISQKLHELEPSAATVYSLYRMSLKKENYNEAISYLKETIQLEQDSLQKADFYYELALLTYDKKKDMRGSKNYALQAISLNENHGRAYMLIGNLYVAYSKQYGDSDFEHKTVYWAAVDKFTKAKLVAPSVVTESNTSIASYSKYFPNQEELFFQGFKEGQNYTVGSWINEKTRIRALK